MTENQPSRPSRRPFRRSWPPRPRQGSSLPTAPARNAAAGNIPSRRPETRTPGPRMPQQASRPGENRTVPNGNTPKAGSAKSHGRRRSKEIIKPSLRAFIKHASEGKAAPSAFYRGQTAATSTGATKRRAFVAEDLDKLMGGDKEFRQKPEKKIPEIAPGAIRVITLGGVEEIGKNMTAIEFGNDIVIVDAGLLFPGEEAPGVDYVIPDTTYLEQRRHKIRGLVITHGHLDHIGGIPYLMEKIGNPPIFTSLLTAVMIKKRQEEFPHLAALNISVVDKNSELKLGGLRIRFFAATHTIPDSIGIIIETPFGNVVATGDLKINHHNGVPDNDELETFGKLSLEKNLLLMADSTNVEKPGFSFSEKEVQENVKKIIAAAPGRVIIGTFASLFERIVAIIEAAEDLGKKVIIEGRSMKTNIEIAKELGILKAKRETIISSDEIGDYPENKIVILATGAQGDEFAALMRIAQREHKQVRIKKGDMVMLSSSVIPGNEKAVQKLKDNLARQGAKIVHYGVANVHSSGHSYQGEVEWIHKMIKSRFFVPVHGHHFMLRVHADIALRLGTPEKNIVVPDNGSIIEITNNGEKISVLKDKAPSKMVMVDGLGTGNVQEVVVRDRQLLAQDGMFVIIAIVDMQTGRVRKSPDIISRGFVYLKESQDLLRNVRNLIKKKIEDSTAAMNPIDIDYVKNAVREDLGKYLAQKTGKRPIILPVMIEV